MDTANWGKFSMPPNSHLLGEAKTTIDQMYSVLSYMKTHLNHPVSERYTNRDSHPIFGCLFVFNHSTFRAENPPVVWPLPPSWLPKELLTSQQNLRRTIPYCDHLVRVPSGTRKTTPQNDPDRASRGMKLGWCWTQYHGTNGSFTYMNGLNVWVSCR